MIMTALEVLSSILFLIGGILLGYFIGGRRNRPKGTIQVYPPTESGEGPSFMLLVDTSINDVISSELVTFGVDRKERIPYYE